MCSVLLLRHYEAQKPEGRGRAAKLLCRVGRATGRTRAGLSRGRSNGSGFTFSRKFKLPVDHSSWHSGISVGDKCLSPRGPWM